MNAKDAWRLFLHQSEMLKKMLEKAGAAIVWTKEGGLQVVSYDPTRYWKPGVVVLFTVEANWRANFSWEYRDVLGLSREEEEELLRNDDVWAKADEIARTKGYTDFDDALTDYFSDDPDAWEPECIEEDYDA